MLWETADHKVNSKTRQFTKESEKLENKLLPYDILGSLAHAEMLKQQGYLSETEHKEIKRLLKEIYQEKPKVKGEDVHTFVEERITEKTEAGKKLHTGRSRNDQVVLDTRLLIKEAIIEISLDTVEIIKKLEKFGQTQDKVIPGYTHQRQAMPSTVSLWASSYVDSLVDFLKMSKGSMKILNTNPLGAGAGYGTSLNINRNTTTELLKFSKVQKNPIYCVNRGKHELVLLQNLNHLMSDLQKISEDLINLSSKQKVFKIPGEFCTGSSIMPQKKNPDVLELTRGKADDIFSHYVAVRSIISKLPHGYNRDTQQTKKHLVEAIKTTKETLDIWKSLIAQLETTDQFEIETGIYSVHRVNKLVEQEIPFREAYKEVKQKSKKLNKKTKIDLDSKKNKHQSYQQIEKYWKNKKKEFETMKEKLLG